MYVNIQSRLRSVARTLIYAYTQIYYYCVCNMELEHFENPFLERHSCHCFKQFHILSIYRPFFPSYAHTLFTQVASIRLQYKSTERERERVFVSYCAFYFSFPSFSHRNESTPVLFLLLWLRLK